MIKEPIAITTNGVEFTLAAPTCKQYNWKPKEDITAYELALVIPILHGQPMKDLPKMVCRHFEEV